MNDLGSSDKNVQDQKLWIYCNHCVQHIPFGEFDTHLRICDYCDGNFVCKTIEEEHMINCGNRTEFCMRCNSYIILRDFKIHIEANNCIRPNLPKKTVQELKDEVKNYIKLYK